MPNLTCIHCFVSGKVQGVWFRAATQEEANKLGITGWARNLPDGRVEVMACGEKAKIMQLHAWLKKGPELARVTELSYEEIPWHEYQRFQVM
jgi:acylphosphatase